ncbi:MAG: hypothetical protein HY270_08900 [Deltaproteobacteria bacterium]|nr:hypothetical protein [Deltaproteobacteria bacterium]
MKSIRSFRAPALAAVLLMTVAPTAYARSAGITSNLFPKANTGCNNSACHTAGGAPPKAAKPIVQMTGPALVTPGSTNIYTLTVSNPGVQTYAGMNVATDEGDLAPVDGETHLLPNPISGQNELTHTAPKQGTSGTTIFTFSWTAPDAPDPFASAALLTGWGNAVNHNGLQTGDSAVVAHLATINNTLCPATPSVCSSPGASKLVISNGAKQHLSFVWSKGTASAADFGNPQTTAAYTLCLYADSALAGALRVPTSALWATTTTGFKYKDPESKSLQTLILAANSPTKVNAKMTAIGTGDAIGVPLSLPFTAAGTVTAQLINSENANCWGDAYSGSLIKKNTSVAFKGVH